MLYAIWRLEVANLGLRLLVCLGLAFFDCHTSPCSPRKFRRHADLRGGVPGAVDATLPVQLAALAWCVLGRGGGASQVATLRDNS